MSLNYLSTKFSSKHAGHGMKVKLNNLIIQLRKNCNHPDLLESAFDGSSMYLTICSINFFYQNNTFHNFKVNYCPTLLVLSHFLLIFSAVFYPPVEQIVEQCGKFQLLDRLLTKLFALKHKVSFTIFQSLCILICYWSAHSCCHIFPSRF